MIKNVAKSAFLRAIYVRQIGSMHEIKCMNVVVGHGMYQGLVKIKKMYVFFGFPNFQKMKKEMDIGIFKFQIVKIVKGNFICHTVTAPLYNLKYILSSYEAYKACLLQECIFTAFVFVVLTSQHVQKSNRSLVWLQVDPATVEAEEEGVEDEYQLEDLEIVPADYMLRVGISNFKNAWESMAPDNERVDEYGLGARESLAEAVCAVINILGMQPYEVSWCFSFLSPK